MSIDSYEKFTSWSNEKVILGQFLDRSIKRSSHSLLDVGAGNGQLAQCFVHRFPRVVFIEPDPCLSQSLRRKFPQASVWEKSLEDISFWGENFDCILMVHVLSYLQSPLKELSSLLSVLKEKGEMFLIMLDYSSGYGRFVYDFKCRLGLDLASNLSWHQVSKFLQSRRIPHRQYELKTSLQPPNIEDFLSILDFIFEIPYTQFSPELISEMKYYLGQQLDLSDFKMPVCHRLLHIRF